jgi:membrane-bound metal-dependent hydrolase YbcI (DUF457 family)
MGRTHALSGAVAWLAAGGLVDRVAPALAAHGAAETAAAALVCAGAALLPDLDHPSSTVAHALGPVTHLLARVARVSGGHRHATHSVVFAAAAGAGGWLLGSAGTWSSVVPVVLLAALALAALGVTNTAAAGVLAAASSVYVLHAAGGTLAWLGPAVGLGCLAHIAGDALTEHGVPALWPLAHRFRAGTIDTGSVVERGVVAPCLAIAGGVLSAHVAGWSPGWWPA